MIGAGLNYLKLPEDIKSSDDLLKNFKFFNVTGHGELEGEIFKVPENTFILFQTRSGHVALKKGNDNQFECVNNYRYTKFRSDEVEVPDGKLEKLNFLKTHDGWIDRIYRSIVNKDFFDELLFLSGDKFTDDSVSIYHAGEVIPEMKISFENGFYPYAMMGVYTAPQPKDFNDPIDAINKKFPKQDIPDTPETRSLIESLIKQEEIISDRYTITKGIKIVREDKTCYLSELVNELSQKIYKNQKYCFIYIEACRLETIDTFKPIVRSLSNSQRDEELPESISLSKHLTYKNYLPLDRDTQKLNMIDHKSLILHKAEKYQKYIDLPKWLQFKPDDIVKNINDGDLFKVIDILYIADREIISDLRKSLRNTSLYKSELKEDVETYIDGVPMYIAYRGINLNTKIQRILPYKFLRNPLNSIDVGDCVICYNKDVPFIGSVISINYTPKNDMMFELNRLVDNKKYNTMANGVISIMGKSLEEVQKLLIYYVIQFESIIRSNEDKDDSDVFHMKSMELIRKKRHQLKIIGDSIDINTIRLISDDSQLNGMIIQFVLNSITNFSTLHKKYMSLYHQKQEEFDTFNAMLLSYQ